jgi:hypothetical protein
MSVETYLHPTATVERADQMFRISVYWNGGVDRPCVGGYVLPNKNTADRLASAINAGAVYTGAEIRTDVDGRTYVRASSRVLGRTASADLKRLGF